MSSGNPFDARARRRCLEHAVEKFHRRVTSLAHAIDADLADRGSAAVGSHPKIADAFHALGVVVDDVLAFEGRAEEFQRQRLRDTGEFDPAAAWTEEDGRQLWERLRQELEQLPERLYSQAKRLVRPFYRGGNRRPGGPAETTAADLSYRVDRAFAEGRARMRLAVQKATAAKPEKADGDGQKSKKRKRRKTDANKAMKRAERQEREKADKRLWDAWANGMGQHRTIADLAKAKGISKLDAQHALDRHRKRLERAGK